MSNTGAIPRGAVGPNVDVKKENLKNEKQQNDTQFLDDPLDQKFITINKKGVEKRVPALHKGWATRRTHIRYTRPPVGDGALTVGAMESWMEVMEFLTEDLRYLLTLPHHRFWSQVVYDVGLHDSLESYLSNAHRWYEADDLDECARPVVESIHKMVLLVYVRMSTRKESKRCHITPSVFGDIIYENYLFDICKLFDLCVLYGQSKCKLVTLMLSNIFKHQPNYYSDLTEAIGSIHNVMEKLEDKLGVSEYTFPVALNNSSDRISRSELEDIVHFLLDTFSSLQMFLSMHPPGAKYFCFESFEVKLCQFYDRVFPALVHQVSDCDGGGSGDGDTVLMDKVNITRIELLTVFRSLLHHKCLSPLENEPSPAVVGECVENFMNAMSSCAGEKTFIADYCSIYPLRPDLELFEKHGGDTTMLNFVTDVVTTALNDGGVTADITNHKLQSSSTSNASEMPDKIDENGMNGYGLVPGDVELTSMVSSVQDLLPDLGNHFIKQCLQYYSYSTEEVINALLENTLPPSLATLDRSATIDLSTTSTTQPQPASPSPPPPQLQTADDQSKVPNESEYQLLDRANVYNNDEFDVFRNSQVDRSRIHKGKKKHALAQYEEDPETLEKLKAIAHQYEECGGTSIYEDEFRYEEGDYRPWTYDDEYDDTYDDNEAGNIDEFNADNVKKRPGIIGAGRLNAPIQYGNSQDSSEKSDAEEEGSTLTQEANENKDTTTTSQPQNRQQPSVRPKNKSSTRGVQRIFSKKSSNPRQSTPEQNAGPRPSENGPQADSMPTPNQPRPEMRPFCENPEVVRHRTEQRRMDREAYRNRGPRWHGEGGRGGEGSQLSNGMDDRHPRISHSSTKHSGKSWRHSDGGGGGDEERGYRGGKYKEDTNHGYAQSRQYRNKMIHKNDHKRQGGQAKFNRSN